MEEKRLRKPTTKVHRILCIGESYYVSIPKEFIRLHNLKKGDPVPVLADYIMKVVPMKEE